MSDYLQLLGEALDNRDLPLFQNLLKEHPECMHTPDGWQRWIGTSAALGLLDFIKALVSLGADVNRQTNEFAGSTPIQSAAWKGQIEIVRWLLEQGAKLNFQIKDKVFSPALADAVTEGHLEIVKLLVEHGADINATGGRTSPLGFAEMYGQAEIADYLRSKGATVREIAPQTKPQKASKSKKPPKK